MSLPRNDLSCTFEDGMCNWEQETLKSDIAWRLHQGPTPSERTGPITDHTTGSGDGMYIYLPFVYTTSRISLFQSILARSLDVNTVSTTLFHLFVSVGKILSLIIKSDRNVDFRR